MDEVAELLALKAILASMLYEAAARTLDPERYLKGKRDDIERLVSSAEIQTERAAEVRDKALRRVAELFDRIRFNSR